MYNIIIIIGVIAVIFLLLNSEKLSKTYNKHSVKLIFLLLFVYFIVNKIYYGIAVMALVCVYYYKDMINLNFIKNKIEGFTHLKSEDTQQIEHAEEEESKEEQKDLFSNLDKLEKFSKKGGKPTQPFKEMVSDLRKTFNSIYKEMNID